MLPSSWQSTSKLTIYSSVLCTSSVPSSWLDSLILFCLSLFFFLSSLSFDDWFLFMIFICNHFDFVTNLPRMIWQTTPPPPQEKPDDGHSSYQGLRSAKSRHLIITSRPSLHVKSGPNAYHPPPLFNPHQLSVDGMASPTCNSQLPCWGFARSLTKHQPWNSFTTTVC